MTATPRKPITVFIESEAGTNVKNRFDEKTLARSCPKIAVLTILGSRFASKPRMILQKRGLRKMAVHPCTASHCPPQNGVLGQELAHLGAFQLDARYPYPYGFIIGTKSADGESLDCYVATNLPLRSREQMECEAIGVLEVFENGEPDHKVLVVPAGTGTPPAVDAIVAALRAFIGPPRLAWFSKWGSFWTGTPRC
jgi:hypothetical protein